MQHRVVIDPEYGIRASQPGNNVLTVELEGLSFSSEFLSVRDAIRGEFQIIAYAALGQSLTVMFGRTFSSPPLMTFDVHYAIGGYRVNPQSGYGIIPSSNPDVRFHSFKTAYADVRTDRFIFYNNINNDYGTGSNPSSQGAGYLHNIRWIALG